MFTHCLQMSLCTLRPQPYFCLGHRLCIRNVALLIHLGSGRSGHKASATGSVTHGAIMQPPTLQTGFCPSAVGQLFVCKTCFSQTAESFRIEMLIAGFVFDQVTRGMHTVCKPKRNYVFDLGHWVVCPLVCTWSTRGLDLAFT